MAHDRGKRRWITGVVQKRRLTEDRNQHYNDLSVLRNGFGRRYTNGQPMVCPCWYDQKAIARFKEQPKQCSCWMCGNKRQVEGDTIQEKRQDSVRDIIDDEC